MPLPAIAGIAGKLLGGNLLGSLFGNLLGGAGSKLLSGLLGSILGKGAADSPAIGLLKSVLGG